MCIPMMMGGGGSDGDDAGKRNNVVQDAVDQLGSNYYGYSGRVADKPWASSKDRSDIKLHNQAVDKRNSV